MSDQRNEDLKYTQIPLDEIGKILKLLYKRFMDFLPLKGFPSDTERHISFLTLVDIIARVDKRKAYYQCFHGMKIVESISTETLEKEYPDLSGQSKS
jgi:hypothetical protein